MDSYYKYMHGNYQFILLNKNHIETLFSWNLEEKHFEYYTCRPLNLCKSFEEYTDRILNAIFERKEIIYVLVKEEDCDTPIGKITLFDLNPSNHSAEFGYYCRKIIEAKGLAVLCYLNLLIPYLKRIN